MSVRKLINFFNLCCTRLYVGLTYGIHKNSNLMLLVLSLAVVQFGFVSIASAQELDDEILRWGVCRLFRTLEGAMGGLFATIAGIIAIAFAATGMYKASYGFLFVSVGAFILRSLISLFYGTDFSMDSCAL